LTGRYAFVHQAGETQLHVRLPAELKAWLEEQAKAEMRSLNSQIVKLLAAEKKRQESRPRK